MIRDYCKAKRIFVLSVNDASTSELFTNDAIGRNLPTASIVKVLDRLVREGTMNSSMARIMHFLLKQHIAKSRCWRDVVAVQAMARGRREARKGARFTGGSRRSGQT